MKSLRALRSWQLIGWVRWVVKTSLLLAAIYLLIRAGETPGTQWAEPGIAGLLLGTWGSMFETEGRRKAERSRVHIRLDDKALSHYALQQAIRDSRGRGLS